MWVMRVAGLVSAVTIALTFATMRAGTAAQDPQDAPGVCRDGQTDDTLRPLPSVLVARARTVFGLHMPAEQVRKTTVVRCMNGKVMLCNAGANLPCGKANTKRTLPGATTWCGDHPDVSFIPMFATGHDTIYRWSCSGTTAVAGEPVEAVDARGFVAQYWKPTN
jgi:hypothetical protein